ncbi:MAG: NADase-type glycan-binding domain-containing protein [Chloroflexia bacterium]
METNPSPPRVIVCSTHLYDGPNSNRKTFRKGAEGEERVVARMEALLDNRWTIFRDLVLPDHSGDIDIVLVGPPGVWAIEVKSFTSNMKVENDTWYWKATNGWRSKGARDPSAQAKGNAAALSHFLKSRTAQAQDVPAIVVLGEETPIDLVSTGTDIWQLEHLDIKLLELRTRPPKMGVPVDQIVAVLTSLVSYQNASKQPSRTSRYVESLSSKSQPTEPVPVSNYLPTATSQPADQQTTASVRMVAPPAERERRAIGTALVAVSVIVLSIALLIVVLNRQTFFGNVSLVPGTDPGVSFGPLGIQKPLQAIASNSAPPGKDSQGNSVTYDPTNAIDGEQTTTWRVPGSGVNEVLTLEFARPVRVTDVGLIPGYAKIDHFDNTDRFKQNRRVQRVRLEFSDGTNTELSYADRPELQMSSVPPVITKSIKIRILQTTPPAAIDGRDFAAISEVKVLGQEQLP